MDIYLVINLKYIDYIKSPHLASFGTALTPLTTTLTSDHPCCDVTMMIDALIRSRDLSIIILFFLKTRMPVVYGKRRAWVEGVCVCVCVYGGGGGERYATLLTHYIDEIKLFLVPASAPRLV